METSLTLAYMAVYAITMKIADLLDEHGLRWFKYADIFFGILCGISGSLLVFVANPIVVSVLVAQVISCIIRNLLDYFNHRLAATMILVTAFGYGHIDFNVFVSFLLIFLIFGGLRDYLGNVVKMRGFWGDFMETMPYYPIFTFIYCIFFGTWILFWSFSLYMIAYEIVKKVGNTYGYK